MSSILTRYIATQVVKGSLFTAFVFLTLLNFFTFADEMGDLGTGDYDLQSILTYLLLSSPHNLFQLIPPSVLVGSLITLGSLANHRELVAIQAAGGSRTRIMQSAMLGGLLLALGSTAMGEFIAPAAERRAQDIKSLALKHQISSQSRYGFWVRDGQRFVNVRKIHDSNKLGDITLYEMDETNQLTSATHAGTATHDGERWHLNDINTTRTGKNSALSQHRTEADWNSVLSPEMLNAFVVRPENLSVLELARYQSYMEENAQQSLPVEQAFWGRIMNPLLTMAMLALALPLVLGFHRDMSSGKRAVIGISMGITFYLLDRMLSHLGIIYEIPPMLTALLPTILVLTAAGIAHRANNY